MQLQYRKAEIFRVGKRNITNQKMIDNIKFNIYYTQGSVLQTKIDLALSMGLPLSKLSVFW